MQIHLSDISSSEGMRIQKTAEFGMDTITFQSGSFPVLAKEPIELTDCKGICSQCGKNLNDGPCGCVEEPKDPRMAAISDIFSKFKEV